jgi:hypothetical protein
MEKKSLTRRELIRAAGAAAGAFVVGGLRGPIFAGAGGAPDRGTSRPPLGDYKLKVPDTLDLAERAEFAINALTRATNPRMDYAAYLNLFFGRNPVVMRKEKV